MRKYLTAIFALLWGGVSWAAGPILVDTDLTGNAVVWQDGQVMYDPESTSAGIGGDLGRLDNDEARQLVRELFDAWADITLFNGVTDVSTVSLTISESSGLGDVDTSNLDDHFAYCPPAELCLSEDPPFIIGTAGSGESPILFDEDGSITDLILGTGASSSILGFAGPRFVNREGADLFLREAQAVINGRFIDCPTDALESDPCQSPEVTLDSFKAVIFHELGHFIGLDHAQVNLASINEALAGDSQAQQEVTTMSPLFVGPAQLTPHFDDKVAISSLYPTSAFLSDFCTITGTVFRSDGNTPLQGVNVIARKVGNAVQEATSFVSGALFAGRIDCSEEEGDFQLRGILPGEEYAMEIERIAVIFQGGSSIEPCDPPASGFAESSAAGTFSCASGGQTITAGSASSSDFVTTKEVEIAPPASSGCTLISLQNQPIVFQKDEFWWYLSGFALLFGGVFLLWRRASLRRTRVIATIN